MLNLTYKSQLFLSDSHIFTILILTVLIQAIPFPLIAAGDPTLGKPFGENPSAPMKPYWLKNVLPFTAAEMMRILCGEYKTAIPLEESVPTWEQLGFTISTETGEYALGQLPADINDSFVLPLQRALKNAGYYVNGVLDGYYGYVTADEVGRFQASRGLPVTKWANANTIKALNAVTGSSINPYTGEGFAKALKASLKYIGYYNGELGGEYTEELKACVTKFQQDNNIKAGAYYHGVFEVHLGWVDEKTITALNRMVNEKKAADPSFVDPRDATTTASPE